MDVKELERKAKREALGWIEVSDDPVPMTWAGAGRCVKRGFFPMLFLAAIFAVVAVVAATVKGAM